MYGYLLDFCGIYENVYDNQMRHDLITIITAVILKLYADSGCILSSMMTT